MIRKTLILVVLILLLSTTALAKQGTATLYGVVNDAADGSPLVNTLITIIGESTYHSGSTTTDEKGVYFFTQLPADEYIIKAIPQPNGVYKDGTANVFVGEGKEKEVVFTLKKK